MNTPRTHFADNDTLAYIAKIETELAAAQRQIASMGHVATGATEAYYDADETIADLRQKLAAAQERIKALEGDALRKVDALEHCVKVFRSMANRGAYPEELLPDDIRNDGKALYLGRQGIKFAIDAIDASIAKEAERG